MAPRTLATPGRIKSPTGEITFSESRCPECLGCPCDCDDPDWDSWDSPESAEPLNDGRDSQVRDVTARRDGRQ